MAPKTEDGFYGVRKGRVSGIYDTSEAREPQVEDAAAYISRNLTFDSAQPSSATSSDTKGKKREFGPEVLDTTGWDIVYSDGACKGNGKIGSIAGVGVWWGPNDPRNIAERCPGDQTNNRAELIAILRVLETTPLTKKSLLIRTDSQYSMQCFNSWISKWQQNNWKTSEGKPVKNEGIIRCVSKRLAIRAKSGQKVILEYVKGHSGDIGNDGADAMANRGALLPATAERDWEVIEAQLERQLAQIGTGQVAELTLLAPDDPEEEEWIEAPNKVRKISEDRAAFSTSELVAKHAAHPSLRGPTKVPSKADHGVLSTASHTSISAINQIERPPPSPFVKQPHDNPNKQKPTTSIYPHISGAKSPLRVICAYPPLVPVAVEDVNFDDYADCLLDDSDLANEIF